MAENRSSVLIPADVVEAVNKAFNEIKEALDPYITPLTAMERRDMRKMGDKTIAFAEKVRDYATTNPEFIPGFASRPDFDIDMANANSLMALEQRAQEVFDLISDTHMVSGSEAYQFGLIYYNVVRHADHNGIAAARTIYNDLQQRFPAPPRPSGPKKEKKSDLPDAS